MPSSVLRCRLMPCAVLSLSLAACGPQAPPDLPLGTPPPPPTRAPDGLLETAALQRIVDLQVDREGGALVPLLSGSDPRVRARAAFALASVQDPDAGSALVGALRDVEASVRRDAAFALGQLSDLAGGSQLLAALVEETDREVRFRLLEAIGKVGVEMDLERLLAMDLPGEEAPARNLAISRMGVRGVLLPSGIQHLVAELNATDPEARINAGYYFGRSLVPAPWVAKAGEVRAVLDSLPPADPLAMHLVLGLANLADPQDIPRFLWWARSSPDWRIRANAARAMGEHAGDPRVRGVLMDALEDPSTHVATYAANGIAATPQMPQSERDALKDWVMDHSEDWRTAGPILGLLGRMGEGRFIMDWLAGWGEEDVLPRTRGLGALAFVPGQEVMGFLVDAAGSGHPRIKGTALGGLARRWRVERRDEKKHQTYYQVFAEGLSSGEPSATFIAAPALADSAFLPLGSLDLLRATYSDMSDAGDVDGMRIVLRSVGETGVLEMEPFLREALGHPLHPVREAAEQALRTLSGEQEETEPAAVTPAERRVDWGALAALGSEPKVIMETEKGSVTLVLDSESAPLTVQTIAGFAQEGKYDGVPFHRVVPNFVAQTGDFTRKDGFGTPGFSIRSEFTQTPYRRGVLGMASSGKDTEGSQFFITHSMQPHLDGGYTVFGWVEEGMDVVDAIYEEDRVLSTRVVPGSR